MTALLIMTGLLLLVSGSIKIRSGTRAGIGIQPLTLLELLAAVLWSFAAMLGLGTTGAAVWFVPTGVLLVLVSSMLFSARMTAYRRERAASESRRLENYVKYLSGLDDTSDSGS